MGQVLEHLLTLPIHKKGITNEQYIIRSVIPLFKKLFEEHWQRGTDEYVIKNPTYAEFAQFLIGYKGELFKIGWDFELAQHIQNYNACGCGTALALGSLHTTEVLNDKLKKKLTAKERLTIALDTATQFSCGVFAPFNFVEV